jgi:hypothetical protein
MIFNDSDKLMQYCNGTSWVAMGRRGPSAPPVSSANLIGYWTLDGTSGDTTAADSSTNGFTGTLINMNTGTAWGAGQAGNSLTFDGTDDYVRIPYNATLDYQGQTITIAAWINASSTTGNRRILAMPSDEVGGTEKYSLAISNGVIEVYFRCGSADHTVSAPYPGTGSWHHIAATYNGSIIRLYLDGVEVNSDPDTGNIAAATPATDNLIIGNYGPHWNQYFSGKIDDVRVYTRTLSPAEILSLAGGGGGGGCVNPSAPKGKVIYNGTYHVMQFCNGKDWIAMGK